MHVCVHVHVPLVQYTVVCPPSRSSILTLPNPIAQSYRLVSSHLSPSLRHHLNHFIISINSSLSIPSPCFRTPPCRSLATCWLGAEEDAQTPADIPCPSLTSLCLRDHPAHIDFSSIMALVSTAWFCLQQARAWRALHVPDASGYGADRPPTATPNCLYASCPGHPNLSVALRLVLVSSSRGNDHNHLPPRHAAGKTTGGPREVLYPTP